MREYVKPMIEEEEIQVEDVIAASSVEVNTPTDSLWNYYN